MAQFTLSNFRKSETIDNWPLGSNKRGTAIFSHEDNASKGQRIGRQTPHKNGYGKVKYSTCYKRVCLVDGSDGKTHYIGYSDYGFLSVMSCNMKHQDFSIFDKDENFEEYRQALYNVT